MNYRKMKGRQRKDRRKEKERSRRGIKSTCLHVTDVEQSDLSEQPVINPFILLIAALINHRLTVKKHNVIFLMSEQLLKLSGAAVNWATSSLHHQDWYQTTGHVVPDNTCSHVLLGFYFFNTYRNLLLLLIFTTSLTVKRRTISELQKVQPKHLYRPCWLAAVQIRGPSPSMMADRTWLICYLRL